MLKLLLNAAASAASKIDQDVVDEVVDEQCVHQVLGVDAVGGGGQMPVVGRGLKVAERATVNAAQARETRRIEFTEHGLFACEVLRHSGHDPVEQGQHRGPLVPLLRLRLVLVHQTQAKKG